MCLFEFIRVKGRVKFMKYFKGQASYKSLGTSAHSYFSSSIIPLLHRIFTNLKHLTFADNCTKLFEVQHV